MLNILFLFILLSYGYATYDQDLAKTAVNISQSAYCMSPDSNWNCKTCDSDNIYEGSIVKNGEQVIFGYNTFYDVLFVGFRGSSNIENWISNLHVKLIHPYSTDTDIGVDQGFYNLLDSIKEDVYKKLDTLTDKYNTKNILVTGHSLGAAIATLFSFDILYESNNYNINYLITFGSPRVGNEDFITKFNSYHIYSNRITHYYDIVPHVPEEKLHYRHISQEIWYNEENTNYIVCNDTDNEEDDSCSNSCAPVRCTSTSDHENYLNITMGNNGMC